MDLPRLVFGLSVFTRVMSSRHQTIAGASCDERDISVTCGTSTPHFSKMPRGVSRNCNSSFYHRRPPSNCILAIVSRIVSRFLSYTLNPVLTTTQSVLKAIKHGSRRRRREHEKGRRQRKEGRKRRFKEGPRRREEARSRGSAMVQGIKRQLQSVCQLINYPFTIVILTLCK